ncbi:MAG: hypothetical protein K1X64_07640 [Myxococcaceae bacterium]|nr:hypothetical protein [Myxococcaceae bacterium]
MSGFRSVAIGVLCGGVFFTACTLEPIFLRDDTVFACATSTDCTSGFTCVEGVCRDEDAERDAGHFDAGADCPASTVSCKPDAGFD